MATSGRLAEQLREPTDRIALWWLGNASFAIKHKETLILVDPVCMPLDGTDPMQAEIGERLLHEFPLQATELDHLDAILITHTHGDHAGPKTLSELQRLDPLIVGPQSLPHYLHTRHKLGLDSSRIRVIIPGERIAVGDIMVESVRAIHGGLRGGVSWPAELATGYLLTAGGCTVFHTGDTVLLEDHYDLEDIDVLLLPICNHSWSLRELPRLLSPQVVIPMHYDTYEVTDRNRHWTVGDPGTLKTTMAHPERLVVLEQGEILTFPT